MPTWRPGCAISMTTCSPVRGHCADPVTTSGGTMKQIHPGRGALAFRRVESERRDRYHLRRPASPSTSAGCARCRRAAGLCSCPELHPSGRARSAASNWYRSRPRAHAREPACQPRGGCAQYPPRTLQPCATAHGQRSPGARRDRVTPYSTLLCETTQPHVLLVTLNRPEVRNAFNTRMGEELLDLWTRLATEAGEVRCVVITGAGEQAFCAGADLKERKGMPTRSGVPSTSCSSAPSGRWAICRCR